MPFQILRCDITDLLVDAIVNTANPKPLVGLGVDSAIHKKAGPRLFFARCGIGELTPGQAAITPGFRLKAAYVIHTCAPVWRGGSFGEIAQLRLCYDNAMALALSRGLKSLALPVMGAGNNGFPKDLALQVALDAIRDFLNRHEMDIRLAVYSKEIFALSALRFRDIRNFIDDREEPSPYPAAPPHPAAPSASRGFIPREVYDFSRPAPEDDCREMLPSPLEEEDFSAGMAEALPSKPLAGNIAPGASMSLEDMLRQEDKGFSETLLSLIDRTGKKDSEIYTRANVSRQHFSKIRKNPGYRPTKPTALAFAIALELDLAQTMDLIGRAGFTLTKSSRFDLIILYFIERGNYNLFDINAALFQFDQPLLGA